MHCRALYSEHDGSPKTTYDQEFPSFAFETQASMLACDAYEVCTDYATSLGGFETKKIVDAD
eukprot:930742-Lingulodinium_polyedra.AAC.1